MKGNEGTCYKDHSEDRGKTLHPKVSMCLYPGGSLCVCWQISIWSLNKIAYELCSTLESFLCDTGTLIWVSQGLTIVVDFTAHLLVPSVQLTSFWDKKKKKTDLLSCILAGEGHHFDDYF